MSLNVCMPAYTFYEYDNRVRRYAETLVKRGDRVDVIALRREGQSSYGIVNGVCVHRIQKRLINERGKLSYLYRLLKFMVKSAILMTRQHRLEPYDLIHVHSVPDFEVFAAIWPKLTGAKIIIDIHDIVPEFYASKFGARNDSMLFKALVLIEKVSIAFSNHVIISNDIWFRKIVARSTTPAKCSTIINYPDPEKFFQRNSSKNSNKFIMVYPGSLNWHQGLDIAVRAFVSISHQVPEAEFHVYGDGPFKDYLQTLVFEHGLENRFFIKETIPIEEIAEVMAEANLGVVPKRNSEFGGEAFSTKILEFMSLGIPIIASKTKIDQYYFDDSMVKFFNPGDEKDLSEAMLLLIRNKDIRDELARNALEFAKKNNWDVKKYIYLDLVDLLIKAVNG